MKSQISCPKCGSSDHLSAERRPNGNAVCSECQWWGPYAECFAELPKKSGPEIRVYFLAKIGMDGYANPTEPNLYPDAFVPLVRKDAYEKIYWELDGLKAWCTNEGSKNQVIVETLEREKNALQGAYSSMLSQRDELQSDIEKLKVEHERAIEFRVQEKNDQLFYSWVETERKLKAVQRRLEGLHGDEVEKVITLASDLCKKTLEDKDGYYFTAADGPWHFMRSLMDAIGALEIKRGKI